DGAVMELPGGKEAGFLGHSEADCDRVLGLAVDDAGKLYVANYGTARVLELAPAGATETVLHSSWPWVPTGVFVSGDDLYVLERFGHPYGVVSAFSGKLRVKKIRRGQKPTVLATIR